MSEQLRIKYLTPFDPRRARTNQIADMQFCYALALAGCNVELIAPSIDGPGYCRESEIWAMYNLDGNFKVTFIPTRCSDECTALRITLRQLHWHTMAALKGTRDGTTTFLISRVPKLLAPYLVAKVATQKKYMVVPWLHDVQEKTVGRWLAMRCDAVLVTNSAIRHEMFPLNSDHEHKVFVTGNPVLKSRLPHIDNNTKSSLRGTLGISDKRPLVVYTGKLYIGMNEAEYILEAARRLPDVHFLLTGGKQNVVEYYRNRVASMGLFNVCLTGFLDSPHQVIPYQHAADVLVAYYSRKDHPFAQYNLPNKIAEYMWTGNAIITADFPAVRDVLNERNSALIPPDNVDALVAAIRKLTENPEYAHGLGTQAMRDSESLTFEEVGKRLVDFLEGVNDRKEPVTRKTSPDHEKLDQPLHIQKTVQTIEHSLNKKFIVCKSHFLHRLETATFSRASEAYRVLQRFVQEHRLNIERVRLTFPELRIDSNEYSERPKNVLLALGRTARNTRELFSSVVLFGSLATRDFTDYSDIDMCVVVRRGVFTDRSLFKSAQRQILSMVRTMLQYDPLQHHGVFVIPEVLLQCYPNWILPIEAIEGGCSILGPTEIEFAVVRDTGATLRVFEAVCNGLQERLKETPQNLYDLKLTLSMFMLLPALFLQAEGHKVSKRDSFEKLRKRFSFEEWEPMAWATRIRAKWPTSELTATERVALAILNPWLVSRLLIAQRPLPRTLLDEWTPERHRSLLNFVALTMRRAQFAEERRSTQGINA